MHVLMADVFVSGLEQTPQWWPSRGISFGLHLHLRLIRYTGVLSNDDPSSVAG